VRRQLRTRDTLLGALGERILDQLTPGTGRPYDVDAITTRLVRRLVRAD
jgi:hypothetical protein